MPDAGVYTTGVTHQALVGLYTRLRVIRIVNYREHGMQHGVPPARGGGA